jgi:arabinose-5-phosphate isomerase
MLFMNDIKKTIIKSAKKVLDTEAIEIKNAKKFIDENFVEVIIKLSKCSGRIILSGMGKSGHIAGKIASTLSSTGSPAFFMHPGEASHGDLGMITKDDIVIFLSNSGESNEIYNLIPSIKRIGASIVAITSNEKSEIAKYADYHISSKVSTEACPLGLAPTASSALMLAIGDAIAISLYQLKGFTAEDFLKSHPGGALGKNKFIKIREVMRSINEVPVVNPSDTLKQTIKLITEKKVGYAVVADKLKYLGIFTDGDLRRSILKEASISDEISKWMSTNPFFINEHYLATSAAELMEKNKISSLVVVDNRDDLVGVINFQDLLINKVI